MFGASGFVRIMAQADSSSRVVLMEQLSRIVCKLLELEKNTSTQLKPAPPNHPPPDYSLPMNALLSSRVSALLPFPCIELTIISAS